MSLNLRLVGVVVFCSVLGIGCARKESDERIVYQDFPETTVLTSREIPLNDTVQLSYPFRIKIVEDKALVFDLHNQKRFFHLFSYPAFELLASFGSRGEGPEELLSPENMSFGQDGMVYVLDGYKREISRWGIVSDPEYSVSALGAVKLEERAWLPLDFARLDDSTFLVPDYTGKNRFLKLDQRGKVLAAYGEIPVTDTKRKVGNSTLAQAWRSFIGFDPVHQTVVLATQLGEVLEIYNLADSTRRFVSVGPCGEPAFEVYEGDAVPQGIMGFSDVHVTDRFIYAVFHGRTFKEIAALGERAPDGGKYIYVFDLEGNPVHKYELDRSIYAFCFDESGERLVALDVNSDQPLVEYVIPSVRP